VNDVIFAAAAGALRRYCLATAPAEPLDGCLVRVRVRVRVRARANPN
jgi:hypothetical protein